MKKYSYATLEEYSDFCGSRKDCSQCRLWELCPYSSVVEHIAEDIYPTNWRYAYELSQLMKMSDIEYLWYCLGEFENDKREESEHPSEWRLERMEIRLCCFSRDCEFYDDINPIYRRLEDDLWENDFEPRKLDYLVEYVEMSICEILFKTKEER